MDPFLVRLRHFFEVAPAFAGKLDERAAPIAGHLDAFHQALFFELIGDARDIAIGDHHVARELAHFHAARRARSEEHTSELQSLMRKSYAVFCLKKKKN